MLIMETVFTITDTLEKLLIELKKSPRPEVYADIKKELKKLPWYSNWELISSKSHSEDFCHFFAPQLAWGAPQQQIRKRILILAAKLELLLRELKVTPSRKIVQRIEELTDGMIHSCWRHMSSNPKIASALSKDFLLYFSKELHWEELSENLTDEKIIEELSHLVDWSKVDYATLSWECILRNFEKINIDRLVCFRSDTLGEDFFIQHAKDIDECGWSAVFSQRRSIPFSRKYVCRLSDYFLMEQLHNFEYDEETFRSQAHRLTPEDWNSLVACEVVPLEEALKLLIKPEDLEVFKKIHGL